MALGASILKNISVFKSRHRVCPGECVPGTIIQIREGICAQAYACVKVRFELRVRDTVMVSDDKVQADVCALGMIVSIGYFVTPKASELTTSK